MPAGQYGGYVPPTVPMRYRVLSKGLGAAMWFWMMYRMKQDGPALFGLRHPWEHGDHGSHGHKEEGGH
ncbi:hypothetical protein EC988_006266 [Linderina pennispora]|nr:hypothetical protein EC988_006266 [Linderina pennispora]